MSIVRQGLAAAGQKRERRRSGSCLQGAGLLGRQRISAGLSQKLCEALSLAIRIA